MPDHTQEPASFRPGDTLEPAGPLMDGLWTDGKGYLAERGGDDVLRVRDDQGTPWPAVPPSPGVQGFRPHVPSGSCGDPFEDQRRFMHSMGQSTAAFDAAQVGLYLRLTAEELREAITAAAPSKAARLRELFDEVESLCRVEEGYDEVELYDGLEDVLVTTIGAGISADFPMGEGWDAVLKTNLLKVDPATGKVRRRADGKVLKPDGWVSPKERLTELLASHRAAKVD